MKPAVRALSLTYAMLVTMPTPLGAAAPQISGYTGGGCIYQSADPEVAAGRVCSGSARIRLQHLLPETVQAEAAYELRLLGASATSAAVASSLPDGRSYRISDPGARVRSLTPALEAENPKTSLLVLQNLDRLQVTSQWGSVDMTLGRQAIAFGSGRTANPTDVLAPARFNAPEKDERMGVDGMRFKIATGDLSEIDAGIAAGHEAKPQNSAAWIRSRLRLGGHDLTATIMTFKEHRLGGMDLQTSIGEAGAWIEAAAIDFHGNVRAGPKAQQSLMRIIGGLDYAFTTGLYISSEYLHNTAGYLSDPDDPSASGESQASSDHAFADAGILLSGRNYFSASATYPLTPLSTITANALTNADEGSVQVSPRFQHSLADDVTTEFGLQADTRTRRRVLAFGLIRSWF